MDLFSRGDPFATLVMCEGDRCTSIPSTAVVTQGPTLIPVLVDEPGTYHLLVTLFAADGSIVAGAGGFIDLVENRPNGPGCPPTCVVGSMSLDVTGGFVNAPLP
jgi:hypothetical protein